MSGPLLTTLSSLDGCDTADAIVAAAIDKHLLMKMAGDRLRKLPADESAAARLVRAYETGDAPPWLAAYLLGCIGHDRGYDTVKAILLSSPGMLAESYAGVALMRIRGEEAGGDLERILTEGPTRVCRDGAGYGLAELGGARSAERVLEAIRSGAVLPDMGHVFNERRLLDSFVVELFDSESERDRQAAFHAVHSALAHEERTKRVPRVAAAAAVRALDEGRVRASPKTAARVRERAAEVLG